MSVKEVAEKIVAQNYDFTIPNSKKLGNIKFIYITDDSAYNTLEITADFAERFSSSSTTSTNTKEKLGEKHSMTVMYNAYVYSKDHERVGTKAIKSFSKINVYGKKTTRNDGERAYQISKGEIHRC